ncbi:pyruvate kinase [Teredinibacter haidensis]|uniref:pyruvate kinase n=1 Tax=Teredinibacter haidensis TaxID=2731755 RepID=UPI0009F838EE|nr:pyruvate kinase [Teredinibacter haidensis]
METDAIDRPKNKKNSGSSSQTSELAALMHRLIELRHDMVEFAQERLVDYVDFYPNHSYTPSAWNLAQYLSLRRHDLRTLQTQLTYNGLSSLGHSEAHILQTINNLIRILSLSLNTQNPELPTDVPCIDYYAGMLNLVQNTDAIFGPPAINRSVRIMVTLPGHSATDYALISDLVRTGMNCARINCAHDSPDAWLAMIGHVRRAESEYKRSCKVLMDLSGHKIRTGPMESESTPEARTRKTRANAIRVSFGEKITLSQTAKQSKPATEKKNAVLSCTCPNIFDFISPGEAVWIDDGKIGTIIESVNEQQAILRVTHAGPKGGRIKPDKGLNFPETALKLPALSEADIQNLDFVALHADMVGFSFVQSLSDMNQLIEELSKRDAGMMPIIAKIETRRAVQKLPEILLGSIGRHPIGVMIARGDLAVELGAERMAEVQEELLWICEAAHVPVIWATQVLESLAKKGIASRPELTDAAMGERAECVMLNKGPYILDAVHTLADILSRMEAHQMKKRSQLRALSWWRG